ncbi:MULTISPECIES: DUF3300 domain-containing protein [unclassified Rhizobium]|uniref:DUF3300 domain-containing protein n=1 Tax=unclassified Rhizobium TaxID=2613769 RepID=UPI000714BF57|nr:MULTISPECIES: DUF3300 domain-containing protein [unclassified Rhizobium]KQS84478.1 hypothetical protein ASG50_29745 [Rhizobium sp. Leaf386]KQU08000.1 hypothetical protein ASG68_23335 [Rhizobium sp. Leaf453]
MQLHGLSAYSRFVSAIFLVSVFSLAASADAISTTASAQQPAPPGSEEAIATPTALTASELEVLVARIALFPDELVALVSSSSLYPLQIIEAQRFLEQKKSKAELKPKESWDDSVISLLNYPDILKMMSDDLDWTQALGSALSYQQKDVLIAIQDLRDKAVASGIIKSDEKVKVETQGENVVIQAADPEKIYVPKYEPEMLYEPGYVQAPVSYYDDPYPSYYYPSAPYFAAAITGAAIWAAVIDWDDLGVWGGRWNGDVDIDCNKCFNNIDIDRDKFKMGDVDWKNIDRSKINFDRNQIANIDRGKFKTEFKADRGNNIANRAKDVRRNGGERITSNPKVSVDDVRKSKVDAKRTRTERERASSNRNKDRPTAAARKNDGKAAANRPAAGNKNVSNKPKNVNRKVNKPKPGAQARKSGNRSAVGNVSNKRQTQMNSNRGRQSMNGGGHHRAQSMGSHRGGGGRQINRGGGGGRRR